MDKSEREFQKELAIHQIQGNIIITLGIFLMAIGITLLTFTVGVEFDQLSEENQNFSATVIEVSSSNLGIRSWALFGLGVGIVVWGAIRTNKDINNMDKNYKDILR